MKAQTVTGIEHPNRRPAVRKFEPGLTGRIFRRGDMGTSEAIYVRAQSGKGSSPGLSMVLCWVIV